MRSCIVGVPVSERVTSVGFGKVGFCRHENSLSLENPSLGVCGGQVGCWNARVCLDVPFRGATVRPWNRPLCPSRFDTYRSKKESERLAQYLHAVPAGRILSVAVNDEGSRNLDDAARKAMTRLGSRHFLHLGFRCLRLSAPANLQDPESPPPRARRVS